MIAFIITFILMAFGVVLACFPFVPALPYMFVIAAAYDVMTNFSVISGEELITLGIIAALSILVHQLAGIFGAKIGGARWKSLIWGAVGAFVGTFILSPFIGSLVGLFLGIFVSEIVIENRSEEKAWQSAKGALFGAVSGIVISVILSLAFLITFVCFVFI
jgi:uncharacterized protein YqgC (DUF456 family)